MKDILITKEGKNAKVTPQTEAAKKVFKKETQYPDGLIVSTKALKDILTWAVSHNLTIDSKIEIKVPEIPHLTREQLAVVFPALPASFLPRTLFAFGKAKFKGDAFGKSETTKSWSVNDQFDKGVEYPVYDSEGVFVVGKDGKGYKMTPAAWTKITSY